MILVIIYRYFLVTDSAVFDFIPMLTLVLLNCFNCFFLYLKLELLAQFPALNDKNITIYEKLTCLKLNYWINSTSTKNYFIKIKWYFY